jgi:hypothetical protein
MDNQSQTDSATADITFHVEQSRNNGAFRCNSPIVVSANDLETNLANAASSSKWYFYDDFTDVLNNTLGGFVVGPSTPPLGTGSAHVNPLANSTGRTVLANSQFGGTVLATISALSYSAYQPSGAWSATEAPFVRFNVDFTGSAAYQKSLVYVPSANGAVTQNTWQTQDMVNGGNALWCWSGMTGCGGSGASWPAQTGVAFSNPSAPLQKWSDIIAAYPGIKMHSLFPFVGMRVGEPGPTGLTANLDNFSITISGVTKTYDFGN